ncbi:PH domain-containing protein [Natrarchaeobaculum aegyptiacum]|uniref:Low molecular weight protein antigen 6 PH domain-containing protein n=1 Tax=Natrarchaeobaculum aegyptiacum TaxID=745377 RepID=A0A2Z2HYB2_9EURY|nr:PH domain-containing protein [Natrarchaeobaculum aegyptiacum]ARS90044.1 hypothetical protein B1756_10105 [Natrarchaeobaculum aegyptiacum]
MAPTVHPLPDTLESPDVGVVAAVGAYVAVCFVAVAISVSLALGGSVATTVGIVSTVATVGVVVGSILARRIDGPAARLGRRRRSLALLFVPPLGLGVGTAVVVAVPAIETIAAVGTGFGAVASGVAALSFAAMARTRYARAVTPDEPVATIPWLDPVHARASVGLGIASIVLAVGTFIGGGLAGTEIGPWLIQASGSVALVAMIVGVVLVLSGLAARSEATGEKSLLEKVRPREPGKKVYGSRYSATPGSDSNWGTPTLEVYETGLVAPGPIGQQFVAWDDVTDVRLESTQLVIDRHGHRSLRCSRSVLDDPDETASTLERFVIASEKESPLERQCPDYET